MNLKLVPVTADNWKTALFLTTDPERKIPLDEQWIANNAFSLVQCQYDPDWDCRLMMDGEQAVGYAKAHCTKGSNNRHLPYKNGNDESGSKSGKGSNVAFSAFHRQHIQQNDQRNSRDACRYDFTDNRCINLCPRHRASPY